MGKKLFVGNLPFSTTSEELAELFARVGTCASATVVTSRDTGQSRGFGFVEMQTDEDAARAVAEMNGTEFGGRKLTVNEAHDRPGGDAGGRGQRHG